MKKATIILVGLFHLWEKEDELSYNGVVKPHVKREFQRLINILKQFNPNKIAVTYYKDKQSVIDKEYLEFIEQPKNLFNVIHEISEIAFPLAQTLNHHKVYAVDWGEIESKWDLGSLFNWAKEYQYPVYDDITKSLNSLEVDFKNTPFCELIQELNKEAHFKKIHSIYLKIASIKNNLENMGVEWLSSWWYRRNMNIFSNLLDLVQSSDDKILLLIGLDHIHIIKEFLENTEHVQVKTLVAASDFLQEVNL